MLILEIIIGIFFLVLAFKIKNASKFFTALAAASIISGLVFWFLKDKLEEIVYSGTGYIFILLLISSIIFSVFLSLLERDGSFALALLPSLISGSILSSIVFVHFLDSMLSYDSDIISIFGFILLPIIIIVFVLIVAIVFGLAIGFPFLICFITKRKAAHQLFTIFSGLICTIFIAIAISHSGFIYYLTDSLEVLI